MPTCFIIQPFDEGGPYDKRYGDVFKPAVEEVGLEPYRVDHDPGVIVAIDKIEQAIGAACVCLADISLDNPNVWFELGYAIASKRDVLLLCSDERKSAYPFDVQHRTIIKYSTDSERDFRKLRGDIVKRLRGLLDNQERTASPLEDPALKGATQGSAEIRPLKRDLLDDDEVAGLRAVLGRVAEVEDEVEVYRFHEAMKEAGFPQATSVLILDSLQKEGMLTRDTHVDMNGNEYPVYGLTQYAAEWVHANRILFFKQDVDFSQHDDPDDLPF